MRVGLIALLTALIASAVVPGAVRANLGACTPSDGLSPHQGGYEDAPTSSMRGVFGIVLVRMPDSLSLLRVGLTTAVLLAAFVGCTGPSASEASPSLVVAVPSSGSAVSSIGPGESAKRLVAADIPLPRGRSASSPDGAIPDAVEIAEVVSIAREEHPTLVGSDPVVRYLSVRTEERGQSLQEELTWVVLSCDVAFPVFGEALTSSPSIEPSCAWVFVGRTGLVTGASVLSSATGLPSLPQTDQSGTWSTARGTNAAFGPPNPNAVARMRRWVPGRPSLSSPGRSAPHPDR